MHDEGVDISSSLDLGALGQRIRDERQRQRYALDALAERSGVSRSMLSSVETGAKAPTVLTLHRIAQGLGTNMSRLLGEERPERLIVLRRADQVVARDPSGWSRRNLAPVLPGVEFEFMRTEIPAGVDAGMFPPHGPGSREYVAVERGTLHLTIDRDIHRLEAGDSIYYAGDVTHGFANPGGDPCIYYLALDLPSGERPLRHHRPPSAAHEG